MTLAAYIYGPKLCGNVTYVAIAYRKMQVSSSSGLTRGSSTICATGSVFSEWRLRPIVLLDTRIKSEHDENAGHFSICDSLAISGRLS